MKTKAMKTKATHTKATHTPGPWEFTPDEIETKRGSHFVYRIESSRGSDFLGTFDPNEDGGDYSEAEANARLIAAAPDLLEAVKTMVEVFRYRHGSSREIVDAVDALIVVIDKAEGR
jgi:hypothetical protein